MYRSILLVLVIVGLVCVHVHGQNIGGEGGEGSVFMGVGRQGMGRLFGGNGGQGGSASGSGPCAGGRGGDSRTKVHVGSFGMGWSTGGRAGNGGDDNCNPSRFRRMIDVFWQKFGSTKET